MEVNVEILVCVRRVPDTTENEIQLNSAGNEIVADELVYSINEPDNYAVEEALQIVAKVGGSVTVATVGGEDDEEVLRREMAMGANQGVLITDEAFNGSDGRGIATILKAFVQKGHYDLILTGVQAEDGGAQIGGMLAALLDYPFASLVNSIEVLEGRKLKISREIEGGNKEMNEIDLPCVLSIQTGINEPRYVGMRGIRQVASVPIPTFSASELGIGENTVGSCCSESETGGLLHSLAGQGRRDSARHPGRKHRQSSGISGSQRRAEVMARIFAYIVHKAGVAGDSAFELAAAARKIDPAASPTAILTGWGADLDAACNSLGASFPEIWKIANEGLAYPNAELVRKALEKVLPKNSILLVAHEHFGIDLAPGLSIKMDAAFVSDVLDIAGVEGADISVVRQEFGGQVSAHVRCDISSGAVLTIRPGAFKAEAVTTGRSGIVDKSSEVGSLAAGRRYLETVFAEAGDVDITKYNVLVSIGRGIQEKENVAIAQELADALGAAVSCSRPVVDAKWMAKSRQVGSSGKTVKPKVYLACGISGAFQHLAGIKGSPFLIAINKNLKAPIFQVADVGIVDDILEFLPEMTRKVREMHGVATK